MARSSGTPASRGFTLLEILVALAILGFALSALLRAFGSGIEQARLAEAATLRVLEARSLVEAAAAAPTLTQGERTGRMGGGSGWRLMVAPVGEGQGDAVLRAYSIVLEVSDGERELLTLRTIAAGR